MPFVHKVADKGSKNLQNMQIFLKKNRLPLMRKPILGNYLVVLAALVMLVMLVRLVLLVIFKNYFKIAP